jgi:hypothetical protein
MPHAIVTATAPDAAVLRMDIMRAGSHRLKGPVTPHWINVGTILVEQPRSETLNQRGGNRLADVATRMLGGVKKQA